MLLAFIHDPLPTLFTYVMVGLFIGCIYLVCQGAWHICKLYKKCEDVDNNNTTVEDATGNNTTGNNTTGNNTTGNNTTGNNTTDNTTTGNNTTDNNTTGNNTTGNNTTGNNTTGNYTTGNNTTGNYTTGNNTTGEDTRDKDNAKLAKLFDTLLYSYMAWAVASSIIIFVFAIIYIITLGSFDDFQELQNITPSILIALLGLFLLKPACKFAKKKFHNNNNNNNNNTNNNNNNNSQGERRVEEEGDGEEGRRQREEITDQSCLVSNEEVNEQTN